jgi:hypothetical protein
VVTARNVGGTPKNKWTKEEDALLEKTVLEFGTDKWRAVASKIPGRTGKQCRERWLGHKSPDIVREEWSPQEDMTLIEKQMEFGHSWAAIKQFLPGRSAVCVKNRWNWLCRRDIPNHFEEFEAIVRSQELERRSDEEEMPQSLDSGDGAPIFVGEDWSLLCDTYSDDIYAIF